SPSPASSAAVRAPCSSPMSAIITLAPSARNRREYAAPIPLPPPVTIATLSCSRIGRASWMVRDSCSVVWWDEAGTFARVVDRTGEVFLITGLGNYANLGVIDAYATVKVGDIVRTARFSGALGPDRMHQEVGPYRIEVLEPLQRVRVVCDGDDHGVGFDLTWE